MTNIHVHNYMPALPNEAITNVTNLLLGNYAFGLVDASTFRLTCPYATLSVSEPTKKVLSPNSMSSFCIFIISIATTQQTPEAEIERRLPKHNLHSK